MPAEAIFPQEYFVYYKGKWCTAGGKDPLFGHVDGFQIDPKKGRHPRGQEHRPAGADADMFAFCKKLFVLTLSLRARLLYNMVKFNKPFALRNMHVGDLRKNDCVFCVIPMINPERHSGGSTIGNV